MKLTPAQRRDAELEREMDRYPLAQAILRQQRKRNHKPEEGENDG